MTDQPMVNDLVRHLQIMTKFWRSSSQHQANPNWMSIEELVLTHGRIWRSQPYSGFRGKMKACFKNATHLVYDDDGYADGGFTYVEGFAIGLAVISVQHAWCIDREGGVVDMTWDEPENAIYCGIPFKRKYLVEVTLKHRYGLLGNHLHHFHLERGLIPVEEWLETSVLDKGQVIELLQEPVLSPNGCQV